MGTRDAIDRLKDDLEGKIDELTDEIETKFVVNAGFKQYLKKLKAMHKKAGTKPNFDKDILYNAYNNGFTAGVIFCEKLKQGDK